MVERLEDLLLLSGTPALHAAAAVTPLPTQSHTVSISSTGELYPLTQVLSGVPQFNPALGSLDSVTVQVSGSVTSVVQVTNISNQPTTFTLPVYGGVTLNGPAIGTPLVDSFPSVSATSPSLASGASFQFAPVVASGTSSETLSDSATLADFTGTGTVSPATAVTQALAPTPNTGTGQFANQVTSSAATVTVTYTYTPTPPGTVSGFVYADINGNGLKDVGEFGFTNVSVALTGTNDLGQSVARETTVTHTGGAYSFGGLLPGTYTVTETTVPPLFIPFKNSRNGVVLPYNKASDSIPSINVTAGNTAPNNNFGLIANHPNPTGTSSLSGYVFDDTTGKIPGIKEPGEPGLATVLVTLTGTSETGLAYSMSTRTNSSGFYQFSNIQGGTYTLNEGPSPANFHHGLTSKNNVVIAGSAGTHLIPNVALADQQVLLNNDFAELRNTSPETPCGPLFITNIQRFGLHNEPTEIVITFNEALDAATAENPANYRLFNTVNFVPTGQAVAYRAIVYNVAAHTVTLIPKAPINVHDQYLLTVGGVETVCDNHTVQGTTGVEGTPYKVTVNRSILSGFVTNQGVFIPVDHGQFSPGTFGLVPPVGGASSAALAGYPVALSSLPAQVNGATSRVTIPAPTTTTTTTTTAAKKTVAAKVTTPKTTTVAVAAVKATTTLKPFSLHG